MFEKLRVLDISTFIAAPAIGANLADYGAEVIKIEHPNGDPLRQVGMQREGASLHWRVYNRNKKLMTLNLSQPEGAEIFKELCRNADIVIENFRAGTLERWGLGWDVLHEINPRLIMVRITGFGQKGPYAGRPAFGTVCEAMSGFVYMNGDPAGAPQSPPVGLADNVCGMVGTAAVTMALYDRDVNTGKGQCIDLAIYEALLSVQGPGVTVYDQTGVVQKRTGNRSQTSAPRNIYQMRDGRWIAVSGSSTKLAASIVKLAGAGELAENEWFSTGRGRVEHVDEIDEAIQDWMDKHTTEEVVQGLADAEVPHALIYNVEDMINDPQVVERGTIVDIPDADLGPIKIQKSPFRFSEAASVENWAGGAKSRDTDAILHDICRLTDEQIQDLKDKEVV